MSVDVSVGCGENEEKIDDKESETSLGIFCDEVTLNPKNRPKKSIGSIILRLKLRWMTWRRKKGVKKQDKDFAVTLAIQNPLILQKILHRVPLLDLVHLRLVNSLWRDLTTDILVPLGFFIGAPELKFGYDSLLGHGHFGVVRLARFEDQDVAVKMISSNLSTSGYLGQCGDILFTSVVQENRLLAQLHRLGSHPNIIQFLGAGIGFSVFELCPKKSLADYMKTYCDVSTGLEGEERIKEWTLVHWCEQLAWALEFLEFHGVVHGDVALRNLMLFDNQVVKLGDFGLAQRLPLNSTTVRLRNDVPIPIAWTAPESLLARETSAKSDVYSLGVTLWEVYNFGRRQPQIQHQYFGNLQYLVEQRNSWLLERPLLADNTIHQTIKRCSSVQPDKRPRISQLKSFFHNLKEEEQRFQMRGDDDQWFHNKILRLFDEPYENYAFPQYIPAPDYLAFPQYIPAPDYLALDR